MQNNIILAGVGGQGILSIAAVIDLAALECGLNIRQAEVHGMSQRGGAVQSHLRISSREIHADLITEGCADLILSVEPLEALRHIPFLAPGGRVVTATDPFVNIPNYPETGLIIAELNRTNRPILVDAAKRARKAGNIRSANMVVLGAATPLIQLDLQTIENGIRKLFASKGDRTVTMNLSAFRSGVEASQSQQRGS